MTSVLPPAHSPAYRVRRFWNWFPLGITYALLYMGRYNLTVAKTSLGSLMSKEEFGHIFAVGTWVYGLAFLLNGPLTDRIGGRRAMLLAAAGAGVVNLALGAFVQHALGSQSALYWPTLLLYAANMYFQSFAAVAIVKVNAHWFHVRERGGFSGIFGTMIASGIFLAFTVNGWILDLTRPDGGADATWWVFYAPGALLLAMLLVESALLRDTPSHAGHADFDTGDAVTAKDGEVLSGWQLTLRILTHPILIVIALIEFCTGVLRQGVMNWFPIYAKEVWKLESSHPLRTGSWEHAGGVFGLCAALAVGVAMIWSGTRMQGRTRRLSITLGTTIALFPFAFGGGWGGLLFVAGVIGGNVAGFCSDLFFQSRRGPSAAFFYALCAICVGVMILTLTPDPEHWQALAIAVFLISISVIGTHGLLSGTASMDFGGRRAAATATGVIDGFVYLGTGLQALALGHLTTRDWAFWPLFLLPFAVVGFLLCLRIWNAKPRAGGGH